ncbi:hypothetical protein AVEN_273207-1 [Araneus ventricosus]|uniref:Uncharacterized protein n=1 Tax=Araneus ventricosus TaxID=182803 RepID=A0A4Y2GUC0_ARAVE|nr:hypothetical protein AVEN_273207-1 [Araneus ventricosus]
MYGINISYIRATAGRLNHHRQPSGCGNGGSQDYDPIHRIVPQFAVGLMEVKSDSRSQMPSNNSSQLQGPSQNSPALLQGWKLIQLNETSRLSGTSNR